MPDIFIQMFGRFTIHIGNSNVECFRSHKAMELLCFLLLNREGPHHRDQLADLFWGDRSTTESKKYFRKTLWQLQNVFEQLPEANCKELILVETDWLQFNCHTEIRLDILEFENSYQVISGIRGQALDQQGLRLAQSAVDLYKGELLEGCYQDWCIYERERYKDMYFVLVEKLMGYCEHNHRYEAGILYGKKLLGLDHARESTHVRLMRFYYLLGDRTGALRQFELCKEALKQELDIEPGSKTLEVYHQIREDNASILEGEEDIANPLEEANERNIAEILEKIKELIALQASLPQQIQKEIQALERILYKDK
jgi:DNA-binding SARP family transcriptional activator